MKIVRKLVDDAGLKVSRRYCNQCEHPTDILYPDQYDSRLPLGSKCGECREVIWFSSVNSSLVKELINRPEDIPQSGDKYLKWRGSVEERFLKLFPLCPSCNKNSFIKIIAPGVRTAPLTCSECGELNNYSEKSTDAEEDYRGVSVWYLIVNI